jgi:putative multiple sugar transport system ATP-binding protein
MPELLGLCDRLVVMNEGALVAEFAADEASQEKIMHAIVNANTNANSNREALHERRA